MQSAYSRFANAILYPPLDRLRGIPISREMRFLAESQGWSRARLDAWQNERLHAVIGQAYAYVPYYRRVMDERGLTPADITSVGDLPKLPVLTKAILRENLTDLIATNADPATLDAGITGGSTGEPMRFYRDEAVLAMGQAAFWRGFGWAGLHRGERLLEFSGGSLGTAPQSLRGKVIAAVARRAFFPAFEIGEARRGDIIALIERFKPKAIKGYVSSMIALARLLEGSGVQVPIVFTTAEKLWPEQAEEISAALGAKVIDYYGCGEVNSIAFQVEQGGPLYVTDEKVVVETLPLLEGAPQPDAETPGRFLLTDLSNTVFPLIRYENGDAGIIDRRPDGSGRNLSRMTSVEGRIHDTITTTKGEPLAGEFFPHLFRFVEGVAYFQIVQDEADHLTVNVVTTPQFGAEQQAFLRGKMQEYAGADMRVDFEEVDDIPRTRAGKMRVTVSLLDHA